MKGKRVPEPLIEVVRGCAARGLSANQTADELTTPVRPLTRNAIIGIAHRNGIKFKGTRGARNPYRGSRAPKTKPYIPKPQPAVVQPIARPSFVTTAVRASIRAPRVGCSWAECTSEALQGDMFCYRHHRRGLVG